MKITKWALDSIIELYKQAQENTEIVSMDDEEENGISQIDPSLRHYLWLAETFSQLFNRKIDVNFTNEFTVFILQNKSKIDRILSTGGTPSILGKGQDGIALQLGTFVLKIFLNDQTYNDAKDALNRLHDDRINQNVAKTEAMIYDVGNLGKFLNNTIYYYIMEKMDIPRKDALDVVRDIVNEVIRYLQSDKQIWEYIKDQFNSENRVNIIGNIKTEIAHITQILQSKQSEAIAKIKELEPDMKDTWVSSLAEEIVMKYLTSRTDIGVSNIGLSNGEFRYFDSSSGEFQRVDPDSGKVNRYMILDKLMEKDVSTPNYDDETVVGKK